MSIYLLDSEQKQKEYLGLLGQAIGDPDFYKGTIKIDDVQATKLVGQNEYKQEGTILQDIGQGAVQGTLGFKDAVFLGLPATIAQGLSTYYSLTGDEEKAKEQRGVASELGKMAKENAETRRALRDYKGGGFAEDFGAGVASTLIFGATGAIGRPVGALTVLGQSIGQRTIEGQQEGELTQEQTNKELAVNVGFGSFEGMLDLFSANKLFSGAFKKQIKKSAGGIKSYGKAFLKSGFEGAVTEAVTEGSQSAIHDIGDIVLGRLEDNEIFNRAMKSAGLGFVVGGTIGSVAGTVGRARAYDEAYKAIEEQVKDTIPNSEKRILANTIVDNAIQNVADIARTQVQYSESIRNEYGALWDNLYNSVYKAYNEVGALSNLSEEERATMIREATAQQATIALEESIRRKVPLKDIFGGKEIKYLGNGKIGLEEITEEQPTQQIESLETVKPETLENVREAGESEEYVRIADKKLPVSYEIVEASDLITSNDSTGKVNEEYPAELQNRDRSRPELVKQVENISENIQPEKVGKNVVAGVGAPIVLRNNVVAIGNGRTNGIKLAYSKDKAESYKQYLKEQGFNIDNFDNPVLVRRVKEEYTPEQLRTIIEEGNTSDTYTFSISEESLNDAQKLSSDLFESYNAEAELDSRENIDFVNKIFNAIVPQAEKGKYIDNSGIITPAGIRRIKNAMLGYLLPNNRLLSSVLETEDEVIKKTSNALLNSASKIVDFEEQIKNGTVEKEYSIIDDIRSAFELYVGAKRSKQDVNVYINNMDMFRKPSDISISLANLFLKSRSAKAVSDVIDSYVLLAQEEGRANQLSLGLTEKQSKEDILNNLLDRDKLYQETIDNTRFGTDTEDILNQSAFHGSPNKELEGGKFDLKYAGKTTGNVHGHGVYAVVSKPSAEYWAGKNGQVYELDVPEDFELIDEQKGFDEQTEKVRYAILGALEKINGFGLLEKAVLDNMPGGEIYVALGKDVFFDKHGYEGGSTEIMKAASEFLDKLGIKGITYDYANEKNFVIFNPADVKVIQKFYQETGTKKPVKKGSYDRNSKIIKFLKSADESTIPHEFAHYWLDSISSFASSGMASNEYMARFKQITDYLGNPVNGKFNRKQSEMFAGAYEKYLATGKAPNSFPLLAVVFDNYKRWIQNVYDSAEDVTISGTNEKPVLNENIISVFDSLLGKDLDISRYAEYMGSKETEKIENKFEEKATPEIERITSPETTEAEIKEDTFEANNIDALIDNTELSPLKPVESTGKVKEGKVSRREIFAEPTMYNVASNEQQIELARKEVIKDPEKVEQMIKGEKGDKNVLTTALYIALGEHYKKTGQTEKLNNLIQEYSERSIRLGQEVQAQIMAKNTPEIFWNASMQKQLLDVLASKNADKLYIDSGTNATDTLMKQINNEVSDFVDSIRNVKDLKEINNKLKDFIKKEKEAYQGLKQADVNPVLFQQDVFDIDGDIKQSELTALVKNRVLKAIGVLLDGEELEKLNTLIRNLDNEYLSNAVFNSNGEPIGWNTTFGNPTPEWFAKRNALQDYVKSKNPSNAIELLTKGVIRASLLSSIKSQTTNIVSNTANWFAERTSKYISNTLLGLTNENNVNKNLIREAKKDILRTFNIGKVDITMAKDVLDDFNLKGEEVVNFAGKGKFWDYAGIYSDFILRKLLGVEDMLFRGYTFVDYMGNYITQKADGRKFKSTNERQNWIDRTFKDAMNINPETAEGKAVRENALADSLFITFQHSSNIASMSLKLREALEKVLDNMGLKGMTYSIMPFVKTPANVIDMNYRYLAGSLAPKNLKTLKRYIDLRRKGDGKALYKFSHSKEGREWANAIARNGVGLAVGIAIAGALGFDFEKYNPSYTSETRGERQLTKQTNRAYNAFDILGGSVSLDYFGALGLPAKTELALASEVKQNALKVVIDAFFDTPGISQFSNIVQGLRDLASGDFEEKKVKSKDWAYNAIIEKYPLLSESGILSYILLNTIETLEMGIPAVGKDLLTSIQNEEGIKDALIRQAFGARVKAIKEDEVSNELRRLLKKGNEVTLSSIVNYKNVKSMPDEDKKEVVKLFEEERNKRIEKLMKEPRYKRMTDTERKQEIENINRKLINEISKKPKIFLRQKKMLQNRNKYNTL